jgi:murein DD-endopeptidase MepM/ murein hydrolase activator NlpD
LILFPVKNGRAKIIYPFGAPIGYNNGMTGGWSGKHVGVDFVPSSPQTNPNPLIVSSAPGTVADSGFDSKGYGNYIIIKYPADSLPIPIYKIPEYKEGNAGYVMYAHLKNVFIQASSEANNPTRVEAGTQIGIMGDTGNGGGIIHLHTEFRLGDANLNRTQMNALNGTASFNPAILIPIDPSLVFTPTDTWTGWVAQSCPGVEPNLGTP